MKRRLCLKITVILGNSKSHYCSRQEKKYIYEKESIVFKKKAREGKERRKVEGTNGRDRKDFYSHMNRRNAPYVQGAKC